MTTVYKRKSEQADAYTHTRIDTLMGPMPTSIRRHTQAGYTTYMAVMRDDEGASHTLILSDGMMPILQRAIADGHIQAGHVRVLVSTFTLKTGDIGHYVHAMQQDKKPTIVCPMLHVQDRDNWEACVEAAYRAAR